MELINCLGKDFEDACFNLASEIISDDYIPDVVIGVAKGGAKVSLPIYNYLKVSNPNIKYCEVMIQRPCTVFMKYIGIKNIFKFMPNICLDWLRKITIYIHEFIYDHFNKGEFKRKGHVYIPQDILYYIHHNNSKILIIDDAIDSGSTLTIINNYINSTFVGPALKYNTQIRYAVLTTTYKNPIIKPNYCLYNRLILRFPWAFDAFKFIKKKETSVFEVLNTLQKNGYA